MKKKVVEERMIESGYYDLGKYVRKMAIDGFIVNDNQEDIKQQMGYCSLPLDAVRRQATLNLNLPEIKAEDGETI